MSFSRSIVTLEAEAPATASSQKATYQPRSTCSVHRKPRSGIGGVGAAYGELPDDPAELALDLGHEGQRQRDETMAGRSTSRVKRSTGAKITLFPEDRVVAAFRDARASRTPPALRARNQLRRGRAFLLAAKRRPQPPDRQQQQEHRPGELAADHQQELIEPRRRQAEHPRTWPEQEPERAGVRQPVVDRLDPEVEPRAKAEPKTRISGGTSSHLSVSR